MKNRIIAAVSVITAVIAGIAICFTARSIHLNSNGKKPLNYTESELVANNMATGVTVIDEKTRYQTINGFGASACWWAQEVGGRDNKDEILSLLYSDTDGIGLNIYRYNLGAGSYDDESIWDITKRTEGFMTDDGTYDFSRDKNARACLETAQNIAGDELRVVLFANSPPVQLTKNGKAYSSPASDDAAPYESNLSEENYEAYADYLYACAEFFTESGYRVTGVSAVNEPQYSWRAYYNSDSSVSMSQEGCHYEPGEVKALLEAVVKKFSNSDLHSKGVRVSMFECGEAEGENTVSSAYFDILLSDSKEYKKENKLLRDYFDTVCVHSYWSSTEKKQQAALMMAERFPEYSIACTEYCQMTNDGNNGVLEYIVNEGGTTNGLTIEYGLAMADIIMTDLAVLNATEWNWWLGCSFGVYPNGLVYINRDNPEEIITSKRLWCLGNFSKFIEEGAVRLAASSGVDELPMVAFRNTDSDTVIVYLNKSERYIKTDISAFCKNGYEVYVTDAEKNLEKTDIVNDGIIEIPAQSLVTVVFRGE